MRPPTRAPTRAPAATLPTSTCASDKRSGEYALECGYAFEGTDESSDEVAHESIDEYCSVVAHPTCVPTRTT